MFQDLRNLVPIYTVFSINKSSRYKSGSLNVEIPIKCHYNTLATIIGPYSIAKRFDDALLKTYSGELIVVASLNDDRRKKLLEVYNITLL